MPPTNPVLATNPIPATNMVQPTAYAPPSLPRNAWTGEPWSPAHANDPAGAYPELIQTPAGTWHPPGIPDWPQDEYLYDGGDRRQEVVVRPNWNVDGLDLEDTVVHYDTLDGDTRIEPSNRVKVYAPRFAAIRKVVNVDTHKGHQRMAGTEGPMVLGQRDRTLFAASMMDTLQPNRNVGIDNPHRFREHTRHLPLEQRRGVKGFQSGLKLYEDLALIRRGEYDNSEKPRLAEGTDNALTWTADEGVQVAIENKLLNFATNDVKLDSAHTYVSIPGKPQMRIVKLASKQNALPGEEVDFTIRFDNVGTELVGNVTVIDNLTTRLEYVEDSQSCTLEANFLTYENDGDSLIVRWEIIEPIKIGTGGVIRFKCRVR